MQILSKIRYTIFFKKVDIKPFNTNNLIFSIFSNYLKETEPVIISDGSNVNLPVSKWKSDLFSITYGVQRAEIDFGGLNENTNFTDLQKKVLDFIDKGKLNLTRLGIIFVYDVDEKFHELFKQKHNFEFLNSEEFECSWLDKKTISNSVFNIWTTYQKIGGKGKFIFDINILSQPNILDYADKFKICFDLNESKLKEFI